MNRLEWVDNAKGIAIFCVVVGHVLPECTFKNTIYSFHMPLFFMLSGLFLQHKMNQRITSFTIDKFKRLYIPYILLGLLILAPYDYIYSTYIVELPELRHEVANRIVGTIPALRNDWPIYGHLWFLPCLFISLVLIKTLHHYSTKRSTIIVLSLTIIGFCYSKYVGKSLPLSLDIAIIAILYIELGMILSKYNYNISLSIVTISIIAFCTGIIFNSYPVDMYNSNYGNPIIYTTTAIGGCLIILKISQHLPSWSLLEYLGKSSMPIYALHYCFLPLASYVKNYLSLSTEISTAIYSILIAIIITLLCQPLIHIIRLFCPILIGETHNSTSKATVNFTK